MCVYVCVCVHGYFEDLANTPIRFTAIAIATRTCLVTNAMQTAPLRII